MKNLEEKTILTFDCFGTLIDWETGIWNALQSIFDHHHIRLDQQAALSLYAEIETEIEKGDYLPYRTVLSQVVRFMGDRLGFSPTTAEMEEFANALIQWPAFPDSPSALQALKQHFKLVVLTNCDDDFFDLASKKLLVKFDEVITAQQVKSYKPSLNNFLFAFDRLGVSPNKILHVAQSLFHDHVPAKQLGLTTVWINRYKDRLGSGATPVANATPDYEFPDMQSFAQFAVQNTPFNRSENL